MSDDGGDGGGKGGGDSGSAGFTNPNNPGGGSISSNAATPASSNSALPLVGTSSSFSPDSSGGGVSFGSGDSGTSPNPLASIPGATSSIGNPAGITSSPTTAGSALGFAPVSDAAGGGGLPTDLTTQPNALDNLSATGNTAGTVPPTSLSPTALTPAQLGQPAAPGTAPAAGGTPAPAAAGDKSVLDSLGIKNPLGAAIAAGGVGYSVLNGQKQDKYAADAAAQANALNAQGQQLLSYLQSGNLPPGLQASLTQATSAAKAKIISNFASQGLNTDPSQNSALASELAAVDQQALISTAQIGQQLMISGIQETGLSSGLYTTLAGIDQTQTAAIGKSIANFASAVSGGGGNSLTDALAKKLSS